MTRMSVSAAKSDPVAVGAAGSLAERRADERARSAELRLGFPSRPSGRPPRADAAADRLAADRLAAPGPVAAIAATPGEPLPSSTRGRMERAFQHDFSRVRLHSGPQAERSAASIDAFAFTLGQHVVLPDPEPAALTHELAHVVEQETGRDAPGVVRRLGAGEAIARFFGGGTFREAELKAYLSRLMEPGATIEDDIDSDNKARAVVEKQLHKDAPVQVRKLLIEEMLSGATVNDDEQAILKILDDASDEELETLVKMDDLRTRLDDKLDGEENDKLQVVLARIFDARDRPIPLDWKFKYSIAGAEEFEGGRQGVKLTTLAVRPEGAKDPIQLAASESITQGGAEERLLRKQVPYPRSKGGEAFADFQVGASDEEGRIKPLGGGVRQVKAGYAPIDLLAKSATLKLDVTMAQQEVGSDTLTSGTSQEHATGSEDFTENKATREEVDTTGRTIDRKATVKKGQKRGVSGEAGVEAEHQQETSTEDVHKEEEQHETGTRDATETIDHTQKTDGTETTVTLSSEVTGELTPSLKAELAGELGVGIADLAGMLIPFMGLSKGLLGKILGKAAKGLGLLSVLGDADKSSLSLKIEGGVSFKVAGTLRGEAAKKWIESTTRTTGTTVTDEDTTRDTTGKSDEHRTGGAHRDTLRGSGKIGASAEGSVEREGSVGVQDTRQHETRRGSERTTGRKDTTGDKDASTTGEEKQTKRLIAVVKDATLTLKTQ